MAGGPGTALLTLRKESEEGAWDLGWAMRDLRLWIFSGEKERPREEQGHPGNLGPEL